MSVVERAAKRLEELKRAGVDIPWAAPRELASVPAAPPGLPAREARTHATPVSEEAHFARSVEFDLARLAQNGYITPDAPRSQLADEFRVIKRPLLANTRINPPVERANLIMVTSSLPGEGKTFVSINLAMSIALELDRHALLIDADPARPALLERLGVPPARGLLDILAEPSGRLGDVVLRTNVERLMLLPAGSPHPHATELLASMTMQTLVDDLAASYPDRIVVFDGPPLLPSPEARMLATLAGQIVFVVEAAKTTHAVVTEALSMVERCPVVMTLLNKTRGAGAGGRYPYGYGGY